MRRSIVSTLAALAAIAGLASCSADGLMGPEAFSKSEDGSYDYEGGGAEEGQGGQGMAGMITAGEWCDLDHWGFWSGLMTGQYYSETSTHWRFWTNKRVAVKVTDAGGVPVAGARVALLKKGEDGRTEEIWNTMTDNRGLAECWSGLFNKDIELASPFLVSIDGEIRKEAPVVSGLNPQEGAYTNVYTTGKSSAKEAADIAFIVDATGSMSDEIRFLKEDLENIISRVAAKKTNSIIRTGSVFYRDEGDDYVTRSSGFTENFKETSDFIKKQNAEGGGDYPEAVHSALEHALKDLEWDESAKCKIAFLILDAPAHGDRPGVIESLQSSIRTMAGKGIKVIPIAASGVNKETEFMLRFFCIATGGTYVFITDDSGIGGDHIEASVGEYQVEQLNDLMIRLIDKYME